MNDERATDWREDLRSRGYRLTPQRELVLKAVQDLDHATPEDLLAEVRRTVAGVNISTIYRSLSLLEEIGLIGHTHLGQGSPVYHLVSEPGHVHLVCRTCDRVFQVDVDVAADLVSILEERHGFRTDARHLTLFGACQGCTSNS